MSTFPTKSAHIRALAVDGVRPTEIASTVGVRYQHVRSVLLAAGLWEPRGQTSATQPKPQNKPRLHRSTLLTSGFKLVASWTTEGADLVIDGELPREAGVYAFCDAEHVYYVGVATMGLAKRLYFYRRPGATQTTSLRVKGLLLEHLATRPMDILIALPGTSQWNGLPVDLNAGLELGLIKNFTPVWNKRGV